MGFLIYFKSITLVSYLSSDILSKLSNDDINLSDLYLRSSSSLPKSSEKSVNLSLFIDLFLE